MPYNTIAYIPALHKGYISFFKKYPGDLYILDFNLVRELPRLERDIRALDPEEVQKAITALNLFSHVEILTKESIKKCTSMENIVMPDEDVSHHIADSYLKDKEIDFISTFLRWDKTISTKEFEVPADRLISIDAFDREIMSRAFKEADKSSDWWRQIGAIAVKDGRVLLIGHNKPLPSDHVHNIFGDPRSNFDAGINIELSKFLHAEAHVIAEAAKKGISLEGASLYVTTFPCPVCAKSVAASGIKKVYYSKGYSLLDAESVLKAQGIEIVNVSIDS